MRRITSRFSAAGALALLVAGCGGGAHGATGSPPPASASVALHTASANSSVRTATPTPGQDDGGRRSSAASTQSVPPAISHESAATPSTSGGYRYTATGWSWFSSPSGKNVCDAEHGEIFCWLSPDVMAAHDDHNFVELGPEGVTFSSGDPGMDLHHVTSHWTQSVPLAPVARNERGIAILPYGSTFTYAGITCASTTNGLDCSNAVARFTVNSHIVTVSGKQH